MRRTRLIWFASGAFVVSFVWVVSIMFLSETDAQMPARLVIGAPDIDIAEAPDDELANVRFAVGQGLQTCGAAEFDIEMSNHGFVYNLPITEENEPVLDCVIETFGGSNEQVSMHIKADNAQTH